MTNRGGIRITLVLLLAAGLSGGWGGAARAWYGTNDPVPTPYYDCGVGGDANNEPPSCVYAKALGNADAGVAWQWTGPNANPATVNGFYVYRSLDGVNWTKLNSTVIPFISDSSQKDFTRGMFSYLDAGPLRSSTQYYYAVTSYNGTSESTKSYDKQWSSDADGSTAHYHRNYSIVTTPRPRAVRGVSVTDNGDGSVTIAWQPNPEPNVTSYKIYQHTASVGVMANGTLVATTGATSATVSGLAYYRDYYFVVAAVDDGGTLGQGPQTGIPSVVQWVMPKPGDPKYYDGSLEWAPPHGSYTDSTIKCSICHGIHSAPGPNQPYLLKWDLSSANSVAGLCFTCHDGTGSNRDAKTEFDRSWDGSSSKSTHPVLQASANDPGLPNANGRNYYGLQLKCTNCHSAHLQPYTPSDTTAETPRLLSPRLKEMVGQQPFFRHKGDGVCYTCHGTGTLNPPNANGYDVLIGMPRETEFEASAHKKYIRAGAAVEPPMPTLIRCLACHKPHGSPNSRLTALAMPYTCFRCHGPNDNSPVYHVSHSVDGTPDSIHEAVTGYTANNVVATTNVSNTAPDIYSLIAASPNDSDTRHDIWPAIDDPAPKIQTYQGGNAKHYNGERDPYTAITCTNCHNPHSAWPQGQANANGNFPIMVDPYNPSPQGTWAGATEGSVAYAGTDSPSPLPGRYAVEGFCWRCHDNTLPTASETLPWAPAPSCGQVANNCGSTSNSRIYVNVQSTWRNDDEMGRQNQSSSILINSIDLTQWYSDNQGGQVLKCTTCHDPHGSPNPYRLKTFIRVKINSTSVCAALGKTSPCYEVKGPLLVYRAPADPTPDGPPVDADFRFFCGACHGAGSMMYNGNWKNNTDGLVFPVACTRCHGHGTSTNRSGGGL